MFDFFSPIDQIRRISSRKAEKNISESYDYLMNDFRSVASILENYYPLEVIKLSLWDERKVLSEKKKDPLMRARAVLLPVILQSVLQSTLFRKGGKEGSISQKDWSRLITLGDDALRRIIRIIDNRTSLFLSSSDADDSDGEKYRSIIARYLIPDTVTPGSLKASSDTLRSLLEAKEGVEEKIGTDPLSLAINMENIAKRGLVGIDDLSRRVQEYSDEYSLAAAQMSDSLRGMSEDEVYRTITKKNGWEGRAENLARERDGYDMFLISSSSSLDESVYDTFTSEVGKLDILSFLKMGYWIAMRYPVFRWNGGQYTFVGKHMPSFIALSASFDRRKAAQKSVQAIFYRTGIDTYTYDGNRVDISVLPSFYDCNIFIADEKYFDTRKIWLEERSVKTGYGHSRLVVDPDMEEEMTHDGDTLVISSLMMFRATIDRTRKKELITALLGELELPSETEEYRVIDEDEIDRGEAPVFDDASDDTITDEYEYETEDDADEKDIPDVPPVEYERKNDKNIAEEEEKYALTDEIIRRDEEIEKEEEKFESELDDDIFDDTEEEERLDEIGEKEESDYYEEVDSDEIHEEAEESADEAEEEDNADSDRDVQLDFFSLLDEEEEKVIDDELDKEDEEEFREEEEKAEKLDTEDASEADVTAELPPDNLPDGGEASIDELPRLDEPEEDNEVSGGEVISVEDIPLDDEEKEELTCSDEAEEDASEEESEVSEEESSGSASEGSGVPGEEIISVEDIAVDDDDDDLYRAEEGEADEGVFLDDEEIEELPHFDEAAESAPGEDVSSDSENEVSDGEAAPGDEETEELPLTGTIEESTSDEKAADDEEPEEEMDGGEDVPPDDDETEEFGESSDDSGNEGYEVSDEEVISEEDVPLDDEEKEELPQPDEIECSSVPAADSENNEASDSEEESSPDEETADEEESEVPSEEDVSAEPEEETTGEVISSDDAESQTDEQTTGETEKSGAASPVEEKPQNKPLDVSSWMKDFLGDYSDDEESPSPEGNETSADVSDEDDGTLEIEDDSFVLPRDGSIEGKAEETDEDVGENTENEEAPVQAEKAEETLSDKNEERARSFASSFLDGVENGEDAESEEEEERQVLSMEELDDESPLPLVTDESVNEEDGGEEEISAEGIIYDIYRKLSPSSVFASFVRSSDSETLDELENVIQNCWNRMQGDGRDKLFNVADYSFSILLSRNNIRDDLRLAELLNNAGGVMYSRGEDEWTAIILYINSDYILEGAIEKTITKDSFSPSDWKRVTYIGEQMKKR